MNFTPKNGVKQIVQEFQLKPVNYTFKKENSASQERKIETVISSESNKHYTDLMANQQKNSFPQEDKSKQVESGKKQTEQKGQSSHELNKKPKQPTMKMKCDHCGKQQVVSAKRTQFRCQSCGQKMLTCMSCTKRVLYMKGVANMIRCTNCSTINIVSQSKKIQENQQYEL